MVSAHAVLVYTEYCYVVELLKERRGQTYFIIKCLNICRVPLYRKSHIVKKLH